MKTILIVSASAGSNLKLAHELSKEISNQNAKALIIELTSLGLPLYHTQEEDNGIPKQAIELANSIKESSALIFLAPEYNGLIPPSLNNAIAWVSRTGENWREAFNNKVCAIGTHSGGGGVHVLIAMRQQLSFLGCNVLGRQIITNFSKALNNESAKAIIEQLLKSSEE